MIIKRNLNTSVFLAGLIILSCCSCKKLISIPQPTGSMTTLKVFSTDNQANSAMAGVYNYLIESKAGESKAYSGFATGLTTILGSMSSNDLIFTSVGPGYYAFNLSKLTIENVGTYSLWATAYDVVYGANAVIEGIEASTSPKLHDKTKKYLTGEAKFVRAFTYFYLVNFFDDVPMALTIDFNKTANMKRTPKAEVYSQIIKDLIEAKSLLQSDFSDYGQERIRANKWAAAALLARVYLYTGDYTNATIQANEVISQSGLFELKTELNDVFLANSKEAIWQLQQNSEASHGTATPEGYSLLPSFDTNATTNKIPFRLSNELKDAFEVNDKRKTEWCWSAVTEGQQVYYPYKYKTGTYNLERGSGVKPTEYYMVLRLAEQYLIRAEAQAMANTQLDLAIADLNVIRHRAGLGDLPATLSRAEVIKAVEHEREIEFFAEWGHRWFDLKRTGRAHDVLSNIPMKQPWAGDAQLLYPIPRTEIVTNHNLVQNPGY